MARREFSKPVKAEMLRRATVNGTVHCEGCGLDLTGKAMEFDHTIAEALYLDKSRKLTANDGKLLGTCCHRGPDGKTAKDVKQIAKAKRQEATMFKRPKGQIKSAGFAKAERPERMKQSLPRRGLYVEKSE